jgi:hypothetical protein
VTSYGISDCAYLRIALRHSAHCGNAPPFSLLIHTTKPYYLSTWYGQLKCDLFQLGLRKYWDQPELFVNLSPNQWRPLVKTAVRKREQARWWRESQGRPILRTYVRLKQPGRLHLESYLTVSHGGWNDRVRLGRCALTRLRCGTNELRIHTGRFDGTPGQSCVLDLRYTIGGGRATLPTRVCGVSGPMCRTVALVEPVGERHQIDRIKRSTSNDIRRIGDTTGDESNHD